MQGKEQNAQSSVFERKSNSHTEIIYIIWRAGKVHLDIFKMYTYLDTRIYKKSNYIF